MFAKRLREYGKGLVIGFEEWNELMKFLIEHRSEIYNDYSKIHYNDTLNGIPCDWFEVVSDETGEVFLIPIACGLILWITDGEQPEYIEFN